MQEPVEELAEPERQRWQSRLVFILAAIGSAVGLGNVWRFPYLVAAYGGGTFLIPYTVCLIGIGMPILLLELALGQKFQGGDVEAFGKMNPHLRGIGIASIFGTFMIISYYAMVIAWTLCYFVQSFGNLPWSTVPGAWGYFFEDMLNYADITGGTEGFGSWRCLMALIATWLCIYFCVFKGVASAGEVVKVTMPVPVVLLIVLMIATITLDGSGGGINQYLGQWDMADLADSEVWTAATGQVFFTLSVTMGVMTAYSSFNPQNQNIVTDEKFISLGDYSIAFISGFTIYSMIGNTVYNCERYDGDRSIYGDGIETKDDCDQLYTQSSLGLAFALYPYGLSTMKGSNGWCVVFFLTLFLLGIDSAFSMIEAITTVMGDTQVARRMKWSKEDITKWTCGVSFLIGSLYTFDTGFGWFDIVDHYVNSYCLLFVGFLECVSTGWVYQCDKQAEKVGASSIIIYNISSLLALIIGCALGFGLTKPTYDDEGGLTGWDDGAVEGPTARIIGICVGLFIWISGSVAAVLKAEGDEAIGGKLYYIMGWMGCDELRVMVNNTGLEEDDVGQELWEPNTVQSEIKAFCSWHTIPIYWGFFIKYLDPILLMIMLCNGIRHDNYNDYAGYGPKRNALGLSIFILAVIFVFLPVFFPVIFMGDKEAREFEGFDFMRWMGIEPTSIAIFGFQQSKKDDDIKATGDEIELGSDEKREPDGRGSSETNEELGA